MQDHSLSRNLYYNNQKGLSFSMSDVPFVTPTQKENAVKWLAENNKGRSLFLFLNDVNLISIQNRHTRGGTIVPELGRCAQVFKKEAVDKGGSLQDQPSSKAEQRWYFFFSSSFFSLQRVHSLPI